MTDKQPLQPGDRVRVLNNDCLSSVPVGTFGRLIRKHRFQRFPPFLWLVYFHGEPTYYVIATDLERIADTDGSSSPPQDAV